MYWISTTNTKECFTSSFWYSSLFFGVHSVNISLSASQKVVNPKIIPQIVRICEFSVYFLEQKLPNTKILVKNHWIDWFRILFPIIVHHFSFTKKKIDNNSLENLSNTSVNISGGLKIGTSRKLDVACDQNTQVM